MGLLSSLVDRRVNRLARAATGAPSATALALHRAMPVVDLVVGSALFRDYFLESGGGMVDLPRLRTGGVKLVGLTIATRFPDLHGTLSNVHFRSLGLPADRLLSNMAIAEWLVGRVEGWAAGSGGTLAIVRTRADLERCLAPGGPVGVLLGVQGGHVLDGAVANIARLYALGVRMLSPAHVMDNELVGSGTGRRRHGLTVLGRAVMGELEASGVIVDLAHMSLDGIGDALPLLMRPFVLSHTGLLEVHASSSRWRRYTPARRNLPAAVVRDVGRAGGLVGAVLANALNGGGLDRAAELVRRLVDVAGAENVAIGSDMDGALATPIDAAGLPLLTDALLEGGLEPPTVEGVMGGNAIALLRRALPA
ncbi:MAG: membrane dipeptidase [Chloroflexota bacterium]|nr:membrane dipeptidase [Chloroflexota bacterium]